MLKMIKRYWPILVITLFIVSPLMLFVTSQPATAKPIILKFAYSMPEKRSVAYGWEWWGDELEKRTGGKVKVEFYPGGTLFKIQAAVDSIIKGVSDIGMISPGRAKKRFQVLNLITLPALGFPDTEEGNYAAGDAFMALTKFPEIQEESKGFQWLLPQMTPNYIIVSKKKKIRSPADLKGVKVGGSGQQMDYVESVGGVPVKNSPPDAYMSLQRGVIDAVFLSWSQVRIYKMYEIAQYYVDFGFMMSSIPVIMNTKKYNSLPDDVKKVMEDIAPEARRACITNMFKGLKAARKSVRDKGRTIITPTPEENKMWERGAEPLWTKWINDMKGRGVQNPEGVLNEWKRLRAEAMK
jgi:TRAP-type C4-dicarboxylate transport system substrate-binding protein